MMYMPRALSATADARNALARLTHVFHSELMTGVPFEINPNQELALEVEDAIFEWETAATEDDTKYKGTSTPGSAPAEPFRVQKINLAVPRGTLAAIVGPVGCGKSSLLQGLVGEMRIVQGRVSFGGKVAYCPQTAWIQNATLVRVLTPPQYQDNC